MKSSAEIRGLKIISINEGQQLSTVKDIIINSAEGRLAFFVINQPSDYLGARLIAFEDILGLGDYALIISESNVIQDVAHNPLAMELIQKDAKVVGSQILTTRGCLIGEVKEIMFEEESGKIVACQVLNPQGALSDVKCDRVITYGKEIILIDDSPVPGKQIKSEPRRVQQVSQPETLNEKELLKKKIEEFSKNDETLLKTANVNANPESLADVKKVIKAKVDASEIFNVFEQRQLQFLEGKTLEKDVLLDNGELLRAGEVITKELLTTVKTRSTLMQLTAHVVK
ncbi:MAG: PRC-barrel domain-containing protein [Desulfitobacteriia bacterium]